jgi:ankyrin repeat protein
MQAHLARYQWGGTITSFNGTVAAAACCNDHVETLGALLARDSNDGGLSELLVVAVCYGSVHTAAVLLCAKANVHGPVRRARAVVRSTIWQDTYVPGNEMHLDPPLVIAARKGHLSCVSLLLSVKADVEFARVDTALVCAAERGHTRVVECLVSAKANVQAPDVDDQTPVYLAAAGRHERTLKVLLDAHADVNAPVPDAHDTPLLFASLRPKQPRIFQLLLAARADVNATTVEGDTALASAIHHKCPHDVVKLLLRAKADVHATNENEYTALHWAAERGSMRIARLLVRAKADVRAKNDFNRTAAATTQNRALAKYLRRVRRLDVERVSQPGAPLV